ncbi:MAG TPA: hypothetical protein VKH41_09120, partial [Myxococcota bacterium]|nr:hypothetical protein [Myxococcota bacterium]
MAAPAVQCADCTAPRRAAVGLLHPGGRERSAIVRARSPTDPGGSLPLETIVIAGGSLAGIRCAEALRRRGYAGRLVLASAER